MARSHQRKKHKEQLRQYQHAQEGNSSKPRKGSISGTIAVIGIILGVAIGYFTTDGSLTWILVGAVAGGIVGFFIGKSLDK